MGISRYFDTKIMHEYLLYFRSVYEFYKFFLSDFLGKTVLISPNLFITHVHSTPSASVPNVPHAFSVLVPYMLRALRALVHHLSRALLNLKPHAFLTLYALKPHVLCALCAARVSCLMFAVTHYSSFPYLVALVSRNSSVYDFLAI